MSVESVQLPSYLPGSATGEPPPLPKLIGAAFRRPGAARMTSAATVLLFLAGVAVFAYPALTDLIGADRQHHVAQQFGKPQVQTEYRHHSVPIGDALTKLVIHNPRIHVDVVVVEGTTVDALRAGAGHYVQTPYPCQPGNVGIAGHRTTFGRPFNRIDQLRAGDTVTLTTPVDSCSYRVLPGFAGHANPWIVAPTDVGVIAQTGLSTGHYLTLTSCNPKGSDAQRIIARAELVGQVSPSTSPRPG